jgi:hypothetical protein
VSSWTSVADASGIAAVATSVAAVIAVIPVAVRQKLSTRSRHTLAPASSQAETHTPTAPEREDQEASVVIEIMNSEDTPSRVIYRLRLPSAGGQGKRLIFKRPFHSSERARVVQFQSGSLILSNVLRDTARGLEEQADIIAAEAAPKRPSEG